MRDFSVGHPLWGFPPSPFRLNEESFASDNPQAGGLLAFKMSRSSEFSQAAELKLSPRPKQRGWRNGPTWNQDFAVSIGSSKFSNAPESGNGNASARAMPKSVAR